MTAPPCRGHRLAAGVADGVRFIQSRNEHDTEGRSEVYNFYDTEISPVFDTFFGNPSSSTNALLKKRRHWGNASALRCAMRTIDMVFFRGGLAEHIAVELARLPIGRLAQYKPFFIDSVPHSLITIDISKSFSEGQFLECLIHEMIHAYIDHYTCYCMGDLCSSCTVGIDAAGLKGHGQYYQTLAIAAETLMGEVWKRREPRTLGLGLSAVHELMAGTVGVNEDKNRAYAARIWGEKSGDEAFRTFFARVTAERPA